MVSMRAEPPCRSKIGPHAVTRNRELLPLPFVFPSAEDLPTHSVAGDQKTLKRNLAQEDRQLPAEEAWP